MSDPAAKLLLQGVLRTDFYSFIAPVAVFGEPLQETSSDISKGDTYALQFSHRCHIYRDLVDTAS